MNMDTRIAISVGILIAMASAGWLIADLTKSRPEGVDQSPVDARPAMIFSPKGPPLVTKLAEVDDCVLYKIQADDRVFYMTREGHVGTCTLQVSNESR